MKNKIQLITYPQIDTSKFPNITISNFSNYKDLDSFEYTLINLNNYEIYEKNQDFSYFYYSDDFLPLKRSIGASNKTNIIILLPQNLKNKKYPLKDKTHIISEFIDEFFSIYIPELIFGINDTEINGIKISSDFFIHFNNGVFKVITENISGNITTIEKENIIFTTLNLDNENKISNFIKTVFIEDEESNVPDWFYDEEWFTDKQQKEIIDTNNKKIDELTEEINSARTQLKINNNYKTILYENGKPLEKTVRTILQELLNFDLSNFKDEKKEDFLIELKDITFIGEIKGVNSNLKTSHLSELDMHYTKRIEYAEENSIEENLKPLIIINRFREIPPKERIEIEKEQINTAINKYEHILIITVESLLHLFEKFLNNEITSEKIIERFTNEDGLFKL